MTPRDLAAVLEAAVREADPATLPELAGELARAHALLALRLAQANGDRKDSADPDVSLDTPTAAQRLGVSPCWLYRRASELPFTIRVGRRLTFSARGLEKWKRQRMGA